ncbi:MAG: hypothetical protein ACPGPS_21750 [Rubripirellula sp.]
MRFSSVFDQWLDDRFEDVLMQDDREMNVLTGFMPRPYAVASIALACGIG